MSQKDISNILFPHHNQQLKRVEDEKINFSHYTNADTAYKIIKNQEIWLRNVALMNDYMEFEHGKKLLVDLINDTNEGKKLKEIFENISTGVFEETFSNFENWAPYIKNDFFILCFSEHETNEDENIGRLSMWRAYGGNAGVAIIFKHDFFKMLASAAKLDFSSVAYLKEEQLKIQIANLGESISSNINEIETLEPKALGGYLFNIFRFAALCNKHKGFEEEQEWRLIATASILPKNEFITQEIQTIQGTPQSIVKIKLSEETYEGKKFKDMIDKVIIGPSQFPFEIKKSVISALSDIGIKEAESIVRVSSIPLRMNH